MANAWVSLYCPQAEFVLKADDAMFVDMYELFIFTRKFISTNSYINDKFLLCPIIWGHRLIRDSNDKWHVSYEDIQKTANGSKGPYPSYCNGKIHLTNPGTASKLVKMAELSKPMPIEDLYVTGQLAKKLGIGHYTFQDLHSLSDRNLLVHKMKQNTKTHTKDFLSGLINRNWELALALTKKAEWCYYAKCKNNIYDKHQH